MAIRGAPLMPSTVVKTLVCVDDIIDQDMTGRIYNLYMPKPVEFVSVFGFVSVMDKFFDEIAFPQSVYGDRVFAQKPETSKKLKKEVKQYMPDDIFTSEQGRKASFMVQVQFRQNATWQGTITWMDEKRTQRFRSTLEMIKLMDNALVENSGSGEPASAWE